jgi:hypothetical protein
MTSTGCGLVQPPWQMGTTPSSPSQVVSQAVWAHEQQLGPGCACSRPAAAVWGDTLSAGSLAHATVHDSDTPSFFIAAAAAALPPQKNTHTSQPPAQRHQRWATFSSARPWLCPQTSTTHCSRSGSSQTQTPSWCRCATPWGFVWCGPGAFCARTGPGHPASSRHPTPSSHSSTQPCLDLTTSLMPHTPHATHSAPPHSLHPAGPARRHQLPVQRPNRGTPRRLSGTDQPRQPAAPQQVTLCTGNWLTGLLPGRGWHLHCPQHGWALVLPG